MDPTWLTSDIPASVIAAEPARRRTMHADEVRYRARLYRGLGYDKDFAVFRCAGNLSWAYEAGGKCPLTKADITKLVGEIYR